ncbi:CRISPR-associated endonuclease Cas2 [Halonatronum saccharophilum]|uniref:CRISPR-associated endonuclease Cas2 n=1 Tax=Halonatronum saccharophilum TaxID=150060 RepID=UPI0004BA04D3|nr:CRISPR-associated endonuclease Cas2 [Halonatronum saccharophilum]
MVNLVISYDISDDKRRNRVFKTLKDYGQRVQYSVFRCDIDKEIYLDLRDKLEGVIKKGEDSIHFYSLCADCWDKSYILGEKDKTNIEDRVIII